MYIEGALMSKSRNIALIYNFESGTVVSKENKNNNNLFYVLMNNLLNLIE